MNEAPPTARPDHDTDPQVWFAAVLQELFGNIIWQLTSGPGPTTVEGIHDTRVAIRRFRSLMRDLKTLVDAHPFKPLLKQLKKLADEMGAVRDEDVFIEGLAKIAGGSDGPAAIHRLLENAHERRGKALQKLSATLDNISADELSGLFNAAAESVFGAPELFWPTSVSAAGRHLIHRRLAELIDASKAIYDPADSKGLHKMRITAKRLRYASNIYVPIFGDQLREFVDETADLQTFLGETHDNDLWIADISAQLQKRERGTARSRSEKNELAALLAKLVRKRAKRYARALDLWTEWQETDRFDNVRALIGSDK